MNQPHKISIGADPNFAAYLDCAHTLADLAAEAILPLFRRRTAVDDKSTGGPYDPVTAADRGAEQVIRARLAKTFPAHGIQGEEFGLDRPDADYRWVIDPIDGTKAFIMGLPVWGTLIGLAHQGRPILGMMHQPFTRERFWSGEAGTHYRGPEGEEVVRTRPCPDLKNAILSTTSPEMFAPGFERERFDALGARVRLRRFGGDCYGYCLLAAGHIDLIVEAGLKPHDILALIPIIERAGGRVTGWDGSDAAKGGRIVASGDPKLHDAALKVLNP